MSDDQSRNYAQELEAMKRKYQELVSETETVRAKVICLESEKTEANRELKRCREALIAQKRGLAGYQEHVQAKRELENQVENHKRQILELQDDLDRLRDLLKETESDTRKYQNQYQDSMDLIEKLTANNVDLKIKVSAFSAELDSIKAAHAFLSSAQSSLQRHSEAVDAELKDTKLQLETEKLARCDDSRKFREELDQKECELQRLRLDAENSENERRLLSRTYNASLKDLRRQLVVATKSHNGSENGKVDHESSQDAMSLRSRASSISSLDASPVIVPSGSNHNNFLPNGVESTASSPRAGDIDRNLLIDKIVNLQRELARKDEKCDFMEDHIALLTAELRKRPPK